MMYRMTSTYTKTRVAEASQVNKTTLTSPYLVNTQLKSQIKRNQKQMDQPQAATKTQYRVPIRSHAT